MKICSRCRQNKCSSEFCKDKKSRDGFQSQCKECKNKQIIAYNKTSEGRAKRRAFDKKRNRKEYRLAYYHKNKVSMNMSRRMRQSLKNDKNGRTWESIVDYTLDDLRSHMESRFNEQMTWDNYGEVWHIDHILPVSSFNIDSVDCDDFKRCWDLMNLQPLIASDNIRKSNKTGVQFSHGSLLAQ